MLGNCGVTSEVRVAEREDGLRQRAGGVVEDVGAQRRPRSRSALVARHHDTAAP